MMMLCTLSRAGYGSVAELMGLDTPELLDVAEHYQIASAIEQKQMDEARNGRS